jgi:hypothetical protein
MAHLGMELQAEMLAPARLASVLTNLESVTYALLDASMGNVKCDVPEGKENWTKSESEDRKNKLSDLMEKMAGTSILKECGDRIIYLQRAYPGVIDTVINKSLNEANQRV